MLRQLVSVVGPLVFFLTTLIARTVLQPPEAPSDVASLPTDLSAASPAPTLDAIAASIRNGISLREFDPQVMATVGDAKLLDIPVDLTDRRGPRRNPAGITNDTDLESIFSDVTLNNVFPDDTDLRATGLSGADVADSRGTKSIHSESIYSERRAPVVPARRAGSTAPSLLSLNGTESVKSMGRFGGQNSYRYPSNLGGLSSTSSRTGSNGSSSAGGGAGSSSSGASGGSGSGSFGGGGFGGNRSSSSAIDEFLARQQFSAGSTTNQSAQANLLGSQSNSPASSSLVATSSRPQLTADGKFGIPNHQYWTFDFKDNDGDNDVDVNDARNHFKAYLTNLEGLLQNARQVVKFSPTELEGIFDDLNTQIPTTPTPRSPSYLTFMIIDFPVKGFYLPKNDIPTNPGLPPGGID